MAKQNFKAPDFLAMAKTLKSDMRRHAKVYCLQWFDDSFQNQGFTDASFDAKYVKNGQLREYSESFIVCH